VEKLTILTGGSSGNAPQNLDPNASFHFSPSALSANRGRYYGNVRSSSGAEASLFSSLTSRLPAIVEKFTEFNASTARPENPFKRPNDAALAAASAYSIAKRAANGKGKQGTGGGKLGGVGATPGAAVGRRGSITSVGGKARSGSNGSADLGLGMGEDEDDRLPAHETIPGFTSVRVEIGGSSAWGNVGGGRSAAAINSPAPTPTTSTTPSFSQCPPVRITWEQAQLSLSVEHFAAVTKPIIGFPSFFAAPLFRRIKQQFPVTKIDVPQTWASEISSLTSAAVQHSAFANASAAAAATVAQEPSRSNSTSKGGAKIASVPIPSLSLAGTAVKGVGGKMPLPPQPPPLPPPSEKIIHFISSPMDFSSSPSLAAALVSDRDTSGVITLPQFLAWWQTEVEPFDPVTRFFRLLKQPTATVIQPPDFQPFMEELLSFHPGLEFLQQTAEFQEKYVRTVIARIFFEWDPLNRRHLSLRTLRRSNLVEAFHEVDVQNDINQVNEYFSYEHFYVLYCKFWELDKDHDYYLTRNDLAPLTQFTPLALDRVYAQAGKPFIGGAEAGNRMCYEDFICFFMASEDKTMPSSLKSVQMLLSHPSPAHFFSSLFLPLPPVRQVLVQCL